MEVLPGQGQEEEGEGQQGIVEQTQQQISEQQSGQAQGQGELAQGPQEGEEDVGQDQGRSMLGPYRACCPVSLEQMTGDGGKEQCVQDATRGQEDEGQIGGYHPCTPTAAAKP